MKFISRLRSFLLGNAAQKYWLWAGVILAILGQSLIREPQSLTAFKTIAEFSAGLNKMFYLALKNPANILVGLFLIALALLIYGKLFATVSGTGNETTPYISDESWVSWKKFLPWGFASLSAYALAMIQIARHQDSIFLFSIWLISIIIFTFIFWKNEPPNKTKPAHSLTSIDGIWITALFAFAIAAGSYLLNDMPAGWIADEGPFWVMARSIALGEVNPSFFDFGIFTFPVSSSIIQGWIMRWAGINMWGWRFASVLPAAITIIPLYLLAHELFDRRIAIASNVMMIVNPYFLTFARLGYNNSQALFPVTLCIYFLVLGLRRNSRFYLWLAGLTAGIGFYTYFAAWLGLVVIVIIASIPLLSGGKIRKNIMPLTIIILGAITVMLPRILYGMSGESPTLLHLKIWEAMPINSFYGRSVFGEDRIAQTIQTNNFIAGDPIELFYDLPLYGIIFLRSFIRCAAALFDPIVNFDHHIIFGLSGPGSSIFFILGLGITLANLKKTQYLIPSIWFLAGFFFLGVFTSFPPRPTHLVSTIPALSLISAIGLVSFLDSAINADPDKLKSMYRWKNMAFASTLLSIAIISFIQFFFLTFYIYFPPNTDEYISWLGRQISQPANIFLVDHQPTDRSPLDENLLKLTQHRVSLVTRSDLEANPGQMKTWKNFVAFIESKDDREYAEWIAQEIPGANVQAAYSPGKRLRGYVVTDMQINASMDISISHGLRGLWNSPTRNILLFCGLGIVILFLRQKAINGQTSNKMSELP